MNVLSIGAAGLAAASASFTASAESAVSGQGDRVAATVNEVSDEQAFNASAAVVRTAEDIMKRLLDIVV